MNDSSKISAPVIYNFPLKTQIPLGIVFAFLNLGVNFLNRFNPIPLYMDTLFTVTASFCGLTSGLIAAVFYHILCTLVNHFDAISLFWALCSVTVVLIIRHYLFLRKKIEATDVLLLVFLVALIISFEGAVLFTVLNAITRYEEDSQIRFMYALLSSSNFPTFLSALLPRVPVNILDKGICVSLGYLTFRLLRKIFTSSPKA